MITIQPISAGYPAGSGYPAMTGYPAGYRISGKKIGRISGQVLIRCNPIKILKLVDFSDNILIRLIFSNFLSVWLPLSSYTIGLT